MSTLLIPPASTDPLAQEAFALHKADASVRMASFMQHTAIAPNTLSTQRLDSLLASDYGLINKQQEWGILSKALHAGQSRTFLLLGDEGLGKTSFVNAYFKALSEHREPLGGYAPHQAIKLQLSLLPKRLWATWDLETLLQDALISWVNDTLACIQHNANQRLQEVGIRLNDAQFSLLLTNYSTESSREARYNLWLTTLKNALAKKQTLLQKWKAPSQQALEDSARILNNPWAGVALQTKRSMEEAPHAELAQRFLELAQAVKTHVSSANTPASFSLLIDEWDVIHKQAPPAQKSNNQSLLRLVKGIQTQKQIPLCLSVTCRTDALSQRLGSPLYTAFKDKILLSRYGKKNLQALVKTAPPSPESPDFSVPEEALEVFTQLSEGQGHKALAIYQAWVKKAEQFGENALSLENFNALAIEHAEELDALFYARLQLDALSYGTRFVHALEWVVAHLDHTPFTVEGFISERLKTAPQGILASHLGLALRKLYLYGMVQKVESPDAPASLIYRVPSRHALECLYGFFVAQNVENLFQHTQGLLTQTQTLMKHEEASQPPQNDAELSRTSFLEQGEAFVHILPKTFNEGELSLEKLQSVLSFVKGLPHENAQHLREKIARFLIEALEQPIEARRLEALSCLAYLPLNDALDALVNASNNPNPTIQQQALKALRQWIQTAHDAKLPVKDKTLPVVETLLEHLNPRDGFSRKDDALTHSLVFDVLKQWHQGQSRLVFKGVHAYVQKQLDFNNDAYLSVGLLDCVTVLLKPFHPTDLELRMPWVLTLIKKALCVPPLHASAFGLLRLLPAQMPQVQTLLKEMLLESTSPKLAFNAFLYSSETLALPVFQTEPPLWKESLHTYIAQQYVPKSDSTLDALLADDAQRQQLIQATLHLIKMVKPWPSNEKNDLFHVLEESLAQPAWQKHLDALWVLLRLKQHLAEEMGLKVNTQRYLQQLSETPTSDLLKHLLANV